MTGKNISFLFRKLRKINPFSFLLISTNTLNCSYKSNCNGLLLWNFPYAQHVLVDAFISFFFIVYYCCFHFVVIFSFSFICNKKQRQRERETPPMCRFLSGCVQEKKGKKHPGDTPRKIYRQVHLKTVRHKES